MNTDPWKRTAAYGVGLWETVSRGATYNPLSPSVIQNPYMVYGELRRRSPVHRSAILGSWVLTRYEDVVAAVTDHQRFSNDPKWRGAMTSVLRPAPDDYSILLMDPPDHMLSVLMIAGNETTTNLIGNGMLALLRHPEQMQRLREEPGRIHDAIDEMLRFDSPVQTDFRIAKARVALRRHVIEPGDGVILLTGSANRDEAAFENADAFDIARKGPRHTSFGHGVHYCVGAELARMEASAIFTEVLRSADTIKACENEPRYRPSTVIRGLAALPMRVGPRR